MDKLENTRSRVRWIRSMCRSIMCEQKTFFSKAPYCFNISDMAVKTLTKLKSQSQKRFNERKYQYLKYKNKNNSGPDT
jgi:aromatic ring hydroxylase